MWLNEYGLDIRCVRMHPYSDGGQVLLDVETVIPIPEAIEYQVRIREKKQKERESRGVSRDKYDVQIAGNQFLAQPKRWMMLRLVTGIVAGGGSPDQIRNAIPWRTNRLFKIFEGVLSADEVRQRFAAEDALGAFPLARRYFCDDGQVFNKDGRTYVFSNQWGLRTLEAVENLRTAFPGMNIKIVPSAGTMETEAD